jgi:hypothetical protein
LIKMRDIIKHDDLPDIYAHESLQYRRQLNDRRITDINIKMSVVLSSSSSKE